MSVTNIPTRHALVKRAEVLLKQIDDYFDDADEWGLTVEQSDPLGDLTNMRKGLISMLDRAGADPSEWPEDLRVREFPR